MACSSFTNRQKIHFRATQAVYAGQFANQILPMRLDEIIRTRIMSNRLSADFARVLPSVIIERVMDGLWSVIGLVFIVATVPLPKILEKAGAILGIVIVSPTVVISNKEGALITHAREELGIDPEQLGGSAWVAAISSFMLFAGGAIVPLFPFIFFRDTTAVVLSAVLSALGFFLIGSSISLFTGRSSLLSGLRQVVFGLVAASITYLIGHLFGVGIS